MTWLRILVWDSALRYTGLSCGYFFLDDTDPESRRILVSVRLKESSLALPLGVLGGSFSSNHTRGRT